MSSQNEENIFFEPNLENLFKLVYECCVVFIIAARTGSAPGLAPFACWRTISLVRVVRPVWLLFIVFLFSHYINLVILVVVYLNTVYPSVHLYLRVSLSAGTQQLLSNNKAENSQKNLIQEIESAQFLWMFERVLNDWKHIGIEWS